MVWLRGRMGLAADIAGYLIGISLSPEMWLAVSCVIYFARSTISFFMTLVVAALCLVAVGFVIIPNYHAKSALFAVLALAIWSSIGWGVRALLRRRENGRHKALLAQQKR